MWGKGYPQLIHQSRNPNPKSKFELGLQIGIVGYGVLLPRSAEGPPIPAPQKSRGRMQAEPGPRSPVYPPPVPFPAFFRAFSPVSRPFSAAAGGLVGVCRTCPGADPGPLISRTWCGCPEKVRTGSRSSPAGDAGRGPEGGRPSGGPSDLGGVPLMAGAAGPGCRS